MSEELPCKYCGYGHYNITQLQNSGRYVLYSVFCGGCGEHLIPVRMIYGFTSDELYSACMDAWNTENKTEPEKMTSITIEVPDGYTAVKDGDVIRVEKLPEPEPQEEWMPYEGELINAAPQVPDGMVQLDAARSTAAIAWGWLWHVTTADDRVKTARQLLGQMLDKDLKRYGIQTAKDEGARGNVQEIEAAMLRGEFGDA